MTIRTLTLIICGLTASGGAMEETRLSLPPPVIESFHPLDEGSVEPSILTAPHPRYLTLKTSLIEERQVIDFEQRAVSFERSDKVFGIVIWQYRYSELDAYIANRSKFAFAGLWSKNSLELLKTEAEKKKDWSILQLELPVQYPTWARRILGKEPPRLTITGYEEIIVSYERSKTDIAGNYDPRPSAGLNFDQENEFTVTGKVGKLIDVSIKATTKKGVDASDLNDPFKNFKLEYKGEGNELEDEVIQEISAGAMQFSMPGTQLAGYTESHKGLIGIQVKSKIGPVELTTIASQEHGEAQKATFDLTSGGGGSTTITEKDFLQNKMFFLDTLYLNYFLRNNEPVPENKKVKRASLQVWLHNEQTLEERKRNEMKNTFCRIGSQNAAMYKLLIEGKDYSISDRYEGCIRFDSINIQESDIIGICMTTKDDTTINKGDTSKIKLLDTTIIKDTLWELKSENPLSSYPNFDLAWRNVYQMPSDFDVAKFKIEVKKIPEVGDTTNTVGGKRYSSILGLTDDNGNANTGNTAIYDHEHNLLVIPPFSENGLLNNKPFANPALGQDNIQEGIYTLTQTPFTELRFKYNIIMTGSTKKSSFQLGMGNIMENTEKVTGDDGQILKRDEDYTIDYQFGSLQLISKAALSKTKINVEYQSESFFVPKSKLFLGMRGEMKLPFGLNSFLGASLLYQSASSQDKIPKIGQEPYSKLLLDANTKMEFEPKWMTSLVNMVPLLSADDKSTASLEFEVANSRTNSNTDKQAYIDDFESSNRPFSLGMDETSWHQAGPPAYITPDSLLKAPPAWNSYWYQPKNYSDTNAQDRKIFKESVFFKLPYRNNPSAEDKYEPTFNFDCQPAPDIRNDISHNFEGRNPWAGILFPINSGSTDRTRDKYLEFYARVYYGKDKNGKDITDSAFSGGGKLYIDMGEVSEDICYLGGPPDHNNHDEDTTSTGNAAFENKFDIGLDGKKDQEEYYLIPNERSDGWDTLKYGSDSLGIYKNDPAKDKYQTYANASDNEGYIRNFPFVNGVEDNGHYDSKDLLGDGLSMSENYFRRYIDFNITFDSASRDAGNAQNYMVLPEPNLSNTKNGWHLFRIPLNDTAIGKFSKVGSPRWDRIRFVRFFWTDFAPAQKNKLNRLQFARIQIVRNEWQETAAKDSSGVVKLTSSTINSDDNPEYSSPPEAPRVTDDQGNVVRESSLRLNFKNILPGDTALVRNILINQSINLSAYTIITMSVHGDATLGDPGDLQYFFRFGNDDSTYYEYRSRLYGGWNNRNTMSINLHDFSKNKQDAMETPGGGTRISLDTTFDAGQDKYYSVKYRNNRPPNFAGITWMAIGITRTGEKNAAARSYTGEFWVDELKVSGVHDFTGWASRGAFNSNWAGFLNLSGRFDYTGADFQQMTSTDNIKLGNSTLSSGLQGSLSLSKFFPSQWGISIPLGGSLSGSLTRPTLVTNSDVYLTDPNTNKADGFADMYKDAVNLLTGRSVFSPDETEAKHYQSATVSRSFYTGFDKTTTSKNPFINFLLDRLSLDYKYSRSLTQNAKGRRPDELGGDYIDSLTSNNHNGWVKYSLSPKPAPEWTKWKPFSGSKSLWIPDRFKNYEFSLLPTTLDFNVAEVTYTTSVDAKDRPQDLGGKTIISTKSLTLVHGATAAWEPINILKGNYTLTINRNLDKDINSLQYRGMDASQKWKEVFTNSIARLDPAWHKYLLLGGERDRTQNATFNFDPTIWDWLSLSSDYSANSRQSAATLQNDSTSYKNFGITTSFHFSTTLTLSSLFKKLSEGLCSLKTVASVFRSIEKGLGKVAIGGITFSYSSNMSLTNNYFDAPYMENRGISGLDFLKYQFGWKGRSAWDIISGDMQDDVFGGMRYRNGYRSSPTLQTNDNDREDRRVSDRSYSIRTNFNLPEPISINISSIGVKYSKNFTVQPDTSYRDTTTTFPEFDISATSQLLNKIKLVTNFFQGLSMSSSYNYQKKVQQSYKPGINDTVVGLSHRFSPLINIDGKLKKWPFDVSYSHNYNKTIDQSQTTGKNTNLEHINKISVHYLVQKTNDVSEVRILFWTVPLKGTFTAGIEFEQGSTQSTQETGIADSRNVTSQDASHYSFTPSASYTFLDNLVGTVSFSASKNKKESVTTASYIFQLKARYTFK